MQHSTIHTTLSIKGFTLQKAYDISGHCINRYITIFSKWIFKNISLRVKKNYVQGIKMVMTINDSIRCGTYLAFHVRSGLKSSQPYQEALPKICLLIWIVAQAENFKHLLGIEYVPEIGEHIFSGA